MGLSAKNGAPLQNLLRRFFRHRRRVSSDRRPHQADAILAAAFRSTLGLLLERGRPTSCCHCVAASWLLRRCSQARCQPYAGFRWFSEISLERTHTVADHCLYIVYIAYESISPGHDSGGSPEDGWRVEGVEGEPRELQHHCVEASCMGEQWQILALKLNRKV